MSLQSLRFGAVIPDSPHLNHESIPKPYSLLVLSKAPEKGDSFNIYVTEKDREVLTAQITNAISQTTRAGLNDQDPTAAFILSTLRDRTLTALKTFLTERGISPQSLEGVSEFILVHSRHPEAK